MSTPLFTVFAMTTAFLFLFAFVMGISRWHDWQDRKRHAH